MIDACSTIVLAAGKGTRMKSRIPKVLHPLFNKELLWYVVNAVGSFSVEQVVVVGHEKDKVVDFLNRNHDNSVKTAYQENQLGTGHAVMKAIEKVSDKIKTVLIVMGDTPLLDAEELRDFVKHHEEKGNACTVLTAKLDNPYGYGRIIRDVSGNIQEIVEEKEASEDIKKISEINTGIYCFDKEVLQTGLKKLNPSEITGEYYLTDIIKMINYKGKNVGTMEVMDFRSVLGVNDRKDLAMANKVLQERINNYHMENGVTILDPENTFIDPEVKIGQDTIIYPGCFIQGDTVIGSECVLGANTSIWDALLKDGVKVDRSRVNDSILESYVEVGPYANIRPGCKLMEKVKIGDFVEIKNSYIGEETKASHLSYIGDAVIGKKVNIGAGTVVVNYDGRQKYETVIKDGVFIGCNSSLIAPVTIKEEAFVAAGSTITHDVDEKNLAIARQRQVNKKDWAQRRE